MFNEKEPGFERPLTAFEENDRAKDELGGGSKRKSTLYAKFEGAKKHAEELKKAKDKAQEGEEKDAEKVIELEQSLEKTEILSRFHDLMDLMKEHKVWAITMASGEKHNFTISELLHTGRPADAEDLSKKVMKSPEEIHRISSTLSLTKTEGRAEHLCFHFTFPIAKVLEGGGKLEQELKKEIINQYAGTTERLKTYKNQAEEVEKLELKEDDKTGIDKAEQKLQTEQKTLVKGDESMMKQLTQRCMANESMQQVTVTSTNGSEWYIEVQPVHEQVNARLLNQKPQEREQQLSDKQSEA